MVVPEIPPDPADTPIARAAEAAVSVRGKGDRQPWPRPPRCRIMTIANQKGGVGKTTTAVNLAASLAQHGSRVLVVDLDPQGNASTALDVPHHSGVPSVYDVLIDDRPLAEVVRPAGEMPGLYCAPATIDLAGAEIELVPVVARELRLARALRAFDMSNLDYVLVDCPPSLGLLTLNALVAAEEVLLPIQCEYYALEGVQQLLNTAELVRVNFNPGLHVSTVLLTMYDGRTRLASDVADDVRAHFGTSVLSTIIPRSVRVSEAPSRGQSVISYDPASSGAIAYTEAARELAMQSAGARQHGRSTSRSGGAVAQQRRGLGRGLGALIPESPLLADGDAARGAGPGRRYGKSASSASAGSTPSRSSALTTRRSRSRRSRRTPGSRGGPSTRTHSTSSPNPSGRSACCSRWWFARPGPAGTSSSWASGGGAPPSAPG